MADKKDTLINDELKSSKDGSLSCNDTVTLHTASSVKLYEGKGNNGLGPIGHRHFCYMMLTAWHAAAQDDPYADDCLLQVYNKIVRIDRGIEKCQQSLNKKNSSIQGIQLSLPTALKERVINLKYTTPYGHQAACLLQKYDYLCRHYISLIYSGFLNNGAQYGVLSLLRKQIRQLFSLPIKWEYTSITRNDIILPTEKGKIIIEKKGLPDDGILKLKKRSPIAPKIHIKK